MNDRAVIGIREPGSLALVQSLLKQGITVRIQVSGDSMQPLLKGGEIVEIASLFGCNPQFGDVLFLCDRQGNPLVHRLIWRRVQNGTLHLLTKGDACVSFDGFSPADNVLGQVRRIIPETGPSINLNKWSLQFHGLLMVGRTLIAFFGRRGMKLFFSIFLRFFQTLV